MMKKETVDGTGTWNAGGADLRGQRAGAGQKRIQRAFAASRMPLEHESLQQRRDITITAAGIDLSFGD